MFHQRGYINDLRCSLALTHTQPLSSPQSLSLYSVYWEVLLQLQGLSLDFHNDAAV